MTTSTVTIVGDVSDLIGNDYDPSRTKVWVQHNTDKVVTDSGPIRLGAATKAVSADGTFSFANVVASTSLVENLQATLWVDWPNTAGPERTRRQVSFGPYDLTGLSGTVDIRTLEETQALDPVASSALLSEMQDLRDEQVAISGIDSTDTAVAYAVQHGAITPGVLSASTVATATPVALAAAGGGGKVGFLGNSIWHGGGNNTATRHDNSPPMHAMLNSDGRWELVVNAGVDGNNSAQLLARVPDIIAAGCNVCVIDEPGANDLAQSVPLATQRAHLASIHAALSAAGIQLVLSTTSPENNNIGTAQQTNAMIKDYAALHNLAVADVWPVLAANNGAWKTGYNDTGGADPTHPDEPARALYGPVIDTALRQVIPSGERVRLVQSTADPLDILEGAGMFLGAQNGALQGFGAQPWNHNEGEEANGIATYSVVDGVAPVRGKWQRCDFNNSVHGHTLLVEKPTTAGPGFAVGETLLFSGRFKSNGFPAAFASVEFINLGGGTISALYAFRAVAARLAGSDGVFAIRGTVPAGTVKTRTILSYSDDAVTAGYCQFAQIGLFNTSRSV